MSGTPASQRSVGAAESRASHAKPIPHALAFEGYSLISGFVSPLREVSFALKAGESMAIVGPAGSGKSMLLAVMSQIVWETAYDPVSITQRGHAAILGEAVTPGRPSPCVLEKLQARISLVSEQTSWLPLSVAENFELSQRLLGRPDPVPFHDLIEGLPLSSRNKAMMLALAELLPPQIEPPLLQELAIIRALLRKPALLLLDEPFVRMDPVLQRQTENLVLEAAEESTLVWATNDLHQASRVTDVTLLMLHGGVMEFTPTPQFFTNPRTEEAERFIAGRDVD